MHEVSFNHKIEFKKIIKLEKNLAKNLIFPLSKLLKYMNNNCILKKKLIISIIYIKICTFGNR